MGLLYFVVRKLSGRPVLSAVLVCFYTCLLDVILWDTYILSDSLGLILECCVIYLFYKSFYFTKQKMVYGVLFWIAVVLFFMTRTNSLSLIIVLIVFLIMRMEKKYRFITLISIGGIAIVSIVFLFVIGRESGLGISNLGNMFKNYYLQGSIVCGRPEYDYLIPESHQGNGLFILDCIIMYFKKYFYYWSVYFSAHSTRHKLLNCITILPLFFTSLASTIMIFRDKKKVYYPVIAGVISYSVIQALTEVDFDMRYRVPIFMLLIIICGYGLNCIAVKWEQRKINKQKQITKAGESSTCL